MNMVQSMMIAKGIPKIFWPEAINWAVHLFNRCPTIVVQNKTPEEAWSGEKPFVGYFRVFGCVADVNDRSWNWGEGFTSSIQSELDWHASESNAEMDDDQEEKEIMEDIDDSYDEVVEQEEAHGQQHSRRQYNKLYWMRDYVTGFKKKGEEGKVYKLKRALCRLKQAPRAWYSRIERYFLSHGFEKCEYEPTLFTKMDKKSIMIASLYVDDLIYTGNNGELMMKLKKSMKIEFARTDMGKMKYFLNLEATQKVDGIFVCQKKYMTDLLKGFGMSNSKLVHNPIVLATKLSKDKDRKGVDKTLYKQMVGSLMYATTTRPDIMYSVSQVSHFVENPKELRFAAIKRIIHCLKGTCEFGLFYQRNGGNDLIGYTDNDYANNVEDRKSTSGYVFRLSEATISWSSKKQPVVSLSTTEAEFIAISASSCQAVWLRRILEAVGRNQTSPRVIYCDNSSAIKLSKNPTMHGISKHIDVRFHFLRDLTRNETIVLQHCNSQEQVADVMTKPLKLEDFI
ncbi:Retrovirus-related Pol polyprotein from transposon TNT 1-94 [Gossypium australe]|uniref:Retrovirus-related Pol polyprotein from transposon TNT 1-94 n=1 Tax=Gossypium australe TaxID=47621 RepID=A0A5B6VFF6_9ROSI|nr:Retrovirus-related Pol polyprotein from transposon TNT 1-94 [Gossypium australe]